MRKIAPGLYEETLAGGDVHLHLDVPELLRAAGYPDTRENRDHVADAAHDLMRKLYPEAAFEVTDEPIDRSGDETHQHSEADLAQLVDKRRLPGESFTAWVKRTGIASGHES